jgi:hypothetical protein
VYIKWDKTTRKRRLAGFGFGDEAKKKKFRVVPGGSDVSTPAPPQRPARRPDQAFAGDERLLNELDRVLDKISTAGMSSLTADERKLLDDVSRRYRQN